VQRGAGARSQLAPWVNDIHVHIQIYILSLPSPRRPRAAPNEMPARACVNACAAPPHGVLPFSPGGGAATQWARGDVGLKPSAAARPDVLRWKKRPAHVSLPYDHCPVTHHNEVKLKQQQLEVVASATLRKGKRDFNFLICLRIE